MKLRKNIFPRRIVDWLCFLLIAIFLPVVYVFEMTVVLPAFHEVGGFFHTFTFLFAIFIVFNIKANMLACMLVDTSLNQSTKQLENEQDWRYCDICHRLAPPRSWHCKICRVCILKRDHHCLFTGCCIGHTNHRYFIMFVIYMCIGSIYALVYNSLYLWVLNAEKYWNVVSFLKIICPALYLANGSIWHEQNLYLIYYSLNLLAVVYSVLLLGYHGLIVIRGGVCFEREKGYLYDAGWKENLRIVLGRRANLSWLSPFIASELPCDGKHWKQKLTEKQEKEKIN